MTTKKIPKKDIYNVVSTIFGNFEDFKKLHPAYAVLTKENMMEGLSAPLHEGAEQYFKEAGSAAIWLLS